MINSDINLLITHNNGNNKITNNNENDNESTETQNIERIL